ncbi:MAG TPA: lysophospholipid acyltransferase family protein [Pirellulales bacterium]|jgi:KDO2-lipid IV(A) lauroyltransferase|nr:lysophospholipid acyltransferase family protein [Pirellulales bacterium]
MRGKQVADFSVYVVVRLFVCFVQAVPLETCHRVCRWLARFATDVVKMRRSVIEENLRHAFPDLTDRERRKLTMRMWEHLFLMVVEIAHTPRKIHDTNWRHYFHFKNGAKASELFFDGRPAVIISGHYGNFELGAHLFGIFNFQTWSIARDLDNPYLHRWVNQFRSSKGQFILPKEGSAETANRVLESGGTLSLLVDQYAGPKGCWVEFFGRPASTHKAIALFSLAHQAPLGVMYARRLGKPLYYEMGVEAVADPRDPNSPANVRELTQWYSAKLEEIIRRAPEQYWWVHRRWKDQHLAPQARKRVA